jgi:hypothetical protein
MPMSGRVSAGRGGFCMQVPGQADERDVDGGQVVSEPPRQVDVGDRAPLGAQALGDLGERAAEPVPAKIRLSAATSAAAMPARRSDRRANPANRT